MATGRVTDDERAAIVATLRDTENVRETARRHGRDPATVSRIAKAEGIEPALRCLTKTATQAKAADNAAKRELLKASLLDDAIRLRAQLWEPAVEKKPMVVSNGGDAGSMVLEVETHLDQPTFADKQRIMTSVGIATDKVIALERLDPVKGTEGRSVLEQLVEAARALAA